jgi:hypothetical protein
MDKTGRIKTRIDDSHAPPGIQYQTIIIISQIQSLDYLLYNYTIINNVLINQLVICVIDF